MREVKITELDLVVAIDALEWELECTLPDPGNPAAERNRQTHKKVYEKLVKLKESLEKKE